MNILFVHQNFPGQFKYLAPALARQGHNVVAFTLRSDLGTPWNGVRLIQYSINKSTSPHIHPWLSDFETKLLRGESCYRAALQLRESGFSPNVIIAHHGWGETLFLKDIWPSAKLGIYCEFYYHSTGFDADFDPEFSAKDIDDRCRLRLKNINNLLNFEIADAGLSPTYWQASTFPDSFRSKITVIHDGIDTRTVVPQDNVSLTLNSELTLTDQSEIVTFVNRNLEPYRGYHIFMRSLPYLLASRPNAHILIVGGDQVSYGAKAPSGKSWKNIFASEVRHLISDNDWKRVHFMGNLPYQKYLALLQVTSVHVYLTYPFVLSWSLLEAMTLGCPIVASNTSPLQEVITNNYNGILVDFFDPKGLADSISIVLEDQHLSSQISINARSSALKNYCLHDVCLPKQISWVEELIDS